jgi:tetratricopeptide (TPR) repeat protein
LAFGLGLPAAGQGQSQPPSLPSRPPAVVGACHEGNEASPERVIADCDMALADKAMAEDSLPGLYRARADARMRRGEVQAAIDDLGQVIARKADDAASLFRRAELRRFGRDNDGAIADFSAGLRLEPGNVRALFARGELYRAKGERRRAWSDFSAVLRLDPAHEAATVNRKELALEIEKLGAMMPVENRPRP